MVLRQEIGIDVSGWQNCRSQYFPDNAKGVYAAAVKKVGALKKQIRDLDEQLEVVAEKRQSEHVRLNEIEERYRARTPALLRKETIECVIDKIEGDWAFVVVVVNGHKEERMMSTALLSKAGVLYEGQPFQIEVTETKTSGGLDSNRRIRSVGDPSQRHLECVRPDLDLGKFRKKKEQD